MKTRFILTHHITYIKGKYTHFCCWWLPNNPYKYACMHAQENAQRLELVYGRRRRSLKFHQTPTTHRSTFYNSHLRGAVVVANCVRHIDVCVPYAHTHKHISILPIRIRSALKRTEDGTTTTRKTVGSITSAIHLQQQQRQHTI